MIDERGYRSGVGILLVNNDNRVLLAKRIGQQAWQLPQGGMKEEEQPEQTVYRELGEEVGLRSQHVQVLSFTPGWLTYRLPDYAIREVAEKERRCIGQKQKWYMLRFTGLDNDIHLDADTQPEFDDWQWVSFWHPLHVIIPFKKEVYRKMLSHFAPILFSK